MPTPGCGTRWPRSCRGRRSTGSHASPTFCWRWSHGRLPCRRNPHPDGEGTGTTFTCAARPIRTRAREAPRPNHPRLRGDILLRSALNQSFYKKTLCRIPPDPAVLDGFHPSFCDAPCRWASHDIATHGPPTVPPYLPVLFRSRGRRHAQAVPLPTVLELVVDLPTCPDGALSARTAFGARLWTARQPGLLERHITPMGMPVGCLVPSGMNLVHGLYAEPPRR